VWPFDGALDELIQPEAIVIAETYPAEYYPELFRNALGRKTDCERRRSVSSNLTCWADDRNVVLTTEVRAEIERGFTSDDAFDAVIGLFGMLDVVLGFRGSGEPKDLKHNAIEGWILGHQAEDTAHGTS
jgi:hypothetical protein